MGAAAEGPVYDGSGRTQKAGDHAASPSEELVKATDSLQIHSDIHGYNLIKQLNDERVMQSPIMGLKQKT